MSTPRHPVSSDPADLETTAELPTLNLAAYDAELRQRELGNTDTWVAPAPPDQPYAGTDTDSFPKHRARLESDLKSLSESLHDLEARLTAKDERLAALEGELDTTRRARAAAEQRADALAGELTDTRLALSTTRAQVDELTRRLGAREAEASTTRARDRSLEGKLAERERTLAQAEQRLHQLQQEASAHLEALRSAEGRHGVLDTLLRGLDGEVSLGHSRIEELQRELQAAHEVERRRIGGLQAELAGLRSQLAERAAALQQVEARHVERNALLDAGAVRLRELEARLAEQARSLEAVQGELRASQERVEAAEGDLRAAEESLRQLESDTRAKDERIEELAKLNDDWRGTLEEARRSLDERDGLIRRLEAETARSTALVDSIQHNIRVQEEPAAAGHLAAEPATRLLIRSDSDGEVVHVLGRRTSIGRTPDNDVQIDTKFVSRHHAMILAGSLQTIIEDLNSTNGVLVNGRRVTRQSLQDGDTLVLGKTHFRFAVRPAAERRTTQ